MKKLLFVSMCCLMAGMLHAQSGTVKMSGSMKSLRVPHTDITAMDIVSELNARKIADLVADAEGNYKVEFSIPATGYYEVGHTKLYLSKGEELKVNLKMMPHGTTFEGGNVAVNRYLNKKRPSSWDVFNKEKAASFAVQKAKGDSIMNAGLAELAQLKADSYFMEMERMRIKATTVSFYLDFYYSGQLVKWNADDEEKKQIKANLHKSIASYVEPILVELTSSDKYLDLPEVRSLLSECEEIGVFKFPHSVALREYFDAVKNKNFIDYNGMNQEEYASMERFADNITTASIQKAFREKLQLKAKLLQGRPAIDIELEDFDGNKHKLSDLKGKPLYVDFWATWCLPCLAQMPHFEELSKQYPDIQFVGISIDIDAQAWRNKLKKSGQPEHIKEFLANPYKAGDAWDIGSIPRFLLIDKDFNIISSSAPRPFAKEEIAKMLDKLSGK